MFNKNGSRQMKGETRGSMQCSECCRNDLKREKSSIDIDASLFRKQSKFDRKNNAQHRKKKLMHI